MYDHHLQLGTLIHSLFSFFLVFIRNFRSSRFLFVNHLIYDCTHLHPYIFSQRADGFSFLTVFVKYFIIKLVLFNKKTITTIQNVLFLSQLIFKQKSIENCVVEWLVLVLLCLFFLVASLSNVFSILRNRFQTQKFIEFVGDWYLCLFQKFSCYVFYFGLKRAI